MESAALASWAIPQLSRLLPLDEESLQQIVNYAWLLPKEGAAEHLKNLLGDTSQALEFISSFNARRSANAQINEGPSTAQDVDTSISEVPRASPRPKKKKQPFNRLPAPRQPENYGNVEGGYIKKNEDDYVSGRSGHERQTQLADVLALEPTPIAPEIAKPRDQTHSSKDKEDFLSRAELDAKDAISGPNAPSSKARTKLTAAGGTSMRGQATITHDIDSAIRALEVQTNHRLVSKEDDSKRQCDCMGQRHALLAATPNCLNCGKIICTKEGLGPCTFCGKALLSSQEIQAMIKVLREERGMEKMEANNASHKRAEVSTTPRPFASHSTPASSTPSSDSEAEKLVAASQHRDRLLRFQADNARRTQIHDEAADFQTPDAGQSIWASPQERALQLKRQQKVLREQEWNARPDYEKRRMVVSIDIVGGKAVRKMAQVESATEDQVEDLPPANQSSSARKETISKNPLLGELIRPMYANVDKGKAREVQQSSKWRRVQDDDHGNK